uniref:Dolichyldiphosphatase n=1 Tax=Blastobotrys adeninivorans TaxID=409370 RepID=A0A060T2U9_BLAAD
MGDPLYAAIALDFTHVYYNGNDVLSQVFAWTSLAPHALLVVYATQIISRREAETILLLAGQLGCELVNKYLKNLIRQERPRFGQGYGMPSAHAQFMCYYATYICLWMFIRVRHFSTHKKVLRAVGLVSMAAIVSYSRVYLLYHSGYQVVAGAAIGIIVGAGWFIVVVLLRDLGIVDLLLDTYPARWFYIKDSAGEKASFVRDEYAEWRRMRMKMKLLVKAE